MPALSSKLNSLTVKETVAGLRTLKVMSQVKKKACHQCRHMTANFGGACKANRNKGPCPIRYCASCLLNRYGKQEKVAQMEDRWTCPKCRGICNCSCCRKKSGQMPTGMLIHVARALGCTSVRELLQNQKGSEAVVASSAGAQAGEDDPIKAAPRFKLFGIWIS